jgi:hypothetical protein
MRKIFHIGLAVPDLERGMSEIGTLFELEWRPVVVRSLTLTAGDGREYDFDVHVTFSYDGPFSVEIWQSIPGTPLQTPESGWFHHIGYWTDEFTGERVRLGKLGYPPFLTHGTDPLLNVGPGNILVEACDLNIDRPHLRDLMPAGSPFAGKPEFPAST